MGNTNLVRPRITITQTTLLTRLSLTYKDPEGTERLWESAERLTRPEGCDIDAIGVAAILQDPSKPNDTPHIVLQKQWRAPADAVVIEIPAGLMDPGETAEACALRELKEETGYVGEVIEGSFGVSPVMFNGEYAPRSVVRGESANGMKTRGFATRISR